MSNSSNSGPSDTYTREDHMTARMETSRGLLDRLGDQLPHRMGRVGVQLGRVCELVCLAVDRVDLDGDLGMAWILLEQARQQLGHAATSAAAVGRGGRTGAGEPETEARIAAQLEWFLQRDLMPWPEGASEVVDFGDGPDRVPDFRPDTPLELLPLQLLAHAAMTFTGGRAPQEPSGGVMAMAFGEYVWTIMTEAMDLLEFCAEQAGQEGLVELADTGHRVADLVSGAFPAAFEVFQGPAGFPHGGG